MLSILMLVLAPSQLTIAQPGCSGPAIQQAEKPSPAGGKLFFESLADDDRSRQAYERVQSSHARIASLIHAEKPDGPTIDRLRRRERDLKMAMTQAGNDALFAALRKLSPRDRAILLRALYSEPDPRQANNALQKANRAAAVKVRQQLLALAACPIGDIEPLGALLVTMSELDIEFQRLAFDSVAAYVRGLAPDAQLAFLRGVYIRPGTPPPVVRVVPSPSSATPQ